MCGITGYCDFTKTMQQETLVSMTNVLHHRGPDDAGVKTWNNSIATVGFGHRRLSVIDLSAKAHQPMVSGDQRYSIVFNGEIYNYREIKKELESEGITFFSDSDTEVVLHACIKWGERSVDKFIGMFAFAIYDSEQMEMMIFRDRAGVKPLYYYRDNNYFLFSSELKSFYETPVFKKEIDRKSIQTYLQYGCILTPNTIFKNTYKLRPGAYIKISLAKRKIQETTYWDVCDFYSRPKLDISLSQAVDETEKLLRSAFEYRMVADVPVGIFLSGGYDSSCVAALLQSGRSQRLKTFSIGFHEQEFNEADHAKKVAGHLGTDHIEYYCTQKDASDIIPELPEIFDEPFGDSSAVSTVLVSRLARKHVTVALSADGGDEVFAGYGRHQAIMNFYGRLVNLPRVVRRLLYKTLQRVEWMAHNSPGYSYNSIHKLRKFIGMLKSDEDVISYLKVMTETLAEMEINRLLIDKREHQESLYDGTVNSVYKDALNSVLAIDYKTYLPDDILTKVDRATMSVSLEGREPFLDHRIIEYFSRLPPEYKIRNGTTKYILKEIVHQYIPREYMDRPKMGFNVPIKYWLKDKLKTLVEHYLDDQKIMEQGIFNKEEVSRLKYDYFKGSPHVNIQKMWIILMFQMWYERWMK